MVAARRVLYAASALWAASAACAASATLPVAAAYETHCETLNRNLGSEHARYLSERGAARTLRLAGRGGAARAAHALLRALLVHALRYDASAVLLDDSTSLRRLQRLGDHDYPDQFILSVASAWHDDADWPTLEQCLAGACGVAGPRLRALRAGAAPVTRSLYARRGPGVDAACMADWPALRRPSCGFLRDHIDHKVVKRSNWVNVTTCPPRDECLTVVVNEDDDEALARELRRSAGALSPPLGLRFVPLRDAHLRADLHNSTRSFLFVDYDMWADAGDAAAEHVARAPPLPRAAPGGAVSVLVADAGRLGHYAPRVLQLALRFRPPPAVLRRILTNGVSLPPEEAACEAANFYKNYTLSWLECDNVCDPKPLFLVYVCDSNYSYYKEIYKETYNYWTMTLNESAVVDFGLVNTSCSYTDDVLDAFKGQVTQYGLYSRIQGLIAMGAAAASSALRDEAASVPVPLMLVAAPPAQGGWRGVRSTAPALPALARAAAALLARCGWRRVALLREEGRSDKWSGAAGLGAALRAAAGEALAARELLVRPAEADAALDELVALGARVVVLDASARAAAAVLAAAQARALTPGAGYAWILLGSNITDADWLPSDARFSYLSVSGGWRGAGEAAGAGRLRAQLQARLRGAWSAHAAPLADALLLALEGSRRLHRRYPQRRYDLHWEGVDREFFKLLDNATIEGVTHEMRGNSSPAVFLHRWNASGARLLGVWPAPGVLPEPDAVAAACGAVRDAPRCRTTSSGDPFTPHCHDFAWATLACVLALTPPALCAALTVRRRRLARRDRAVERRAMLRGGHSADEAAAATALTAHAVPRSALRLIDDLGAGHYGVVRLAVLRVPGGDAIAVAAKAPREDAPAGAAADMLREAALLATLRHEHVVRFVGVCWEGGPLMLMEHAFHGDLRRYLRRRRPAAERALAGLPEPAAADVQPPALTRLAREAAAALDYLKRRQLVHRDVRAANCLVDARHSLKLGDFGMARRLDAPPGEGEYACKRRAMFPVLWMAPESLAGGVFSTASDVWALGVLLLELATLGERPYGAWSTARVLRHVRDGGAPPLPRDAAACTRGVTAACWRREPRQRPSAAQLLAYLAAHPRAVAPALVPAGDADASVDADAAGDADATPPSPDSGLYIDEWTCH